MVDSPFFCLIKSEVDADSLVVVIYRAAVFSDNRNLEFPCLVCAERAFALRDCQSLGVFVPSEGDFRKSAFLIVERCAVVLV